VDLISVNFPSTFDFSAIEFVGQDSLMALTGSTWQTAELSISHDAGISWDNNQIFNKKIFSLSHQRRRNRSYLGVCWRWFSMAQ
jgi:hypothetical protein